MQELQEQIKALLPHMAELQLKNVLEYVLDELDAPNHEDQLLKMLQAVSQDSTLFQVRQAILASELADKDAVLAVIDSIKK